MSSNLSSAEQHQHTADSWLEELNFYEMEIGSCELSLEQFVLPLQKSNSMASVERFQNQFIHQREVINGLKHKVRQYMQALPAEGPDASFLRHFEVLSDEVNLFRRYFNELLLDFDRLLRELG